MCLLVCFAEKNVKPLGVSGRRDKLVGEEGAAYLGPGLATFPGLTSGQSEESTPAYTGEILRSLRGDS